MDYFCTHVFCIEQGFCWWIQACLSSESSCPINWMRLQFLTCWCCSSAWQAKERSRWYSRSCLGTLWLSYMLQQRWSKKKKVGKKSHSCKLCLMRDRQWGRQWGLTNKDWPMAWGHCERCDMTSGHHARLCEYPYKHSLLYKQLRKTTRVKYWCFGSVHCLKVTAT